MSCIPKKASACLLSWKRPQNMQAIVDHLRKLPFIDDIIIWNNNPKVKLSIRGRDVHIVQSPRNVITYGRFLAVSHARNPIIYTQDDDHLVYGIPELFEKFLKDSSRISHGLIPRCYKNRKASLYGSAHIALMGWGGFFNREWVDVFEEYIQEHGADSLLLQEADRIFSILLHRHHTMSEVQVEHLGGSSGMEALWVQPGHQKKVLLATKRALQLIGVPLTHLSRHVVKYQGEQNKFVIYASGRSGSNYLCSALRSHPDILCHNELFHRSAVFRAYPLSPKKKMDSIAWRDAHVEEFLENVWKQNQGRAKVGFKLLHSQDWNVALHLIEDPSIFSLLLGRRNVVRQYVSLRLAAKTNQWLLKKPWRRSFATVRVEPNKLMQFVEEVNKFFARVRLNLVNSGQEYLEIFYEDITGPQKEEWFEKIFTYLGVSPIPSVEADTKKQNPESLSELVENFSELRSYLRGTELEKYLYEEELCKA